MSEHFSGRPVYEWQVPFGLDEAFGYKSIATAADVICNGKTIKNYANMEWKQRSSENGKGLLLENENTQQQIYLIDSNNASEMISQWSPQKVVIHCGAERLLTQMKSKFGAHE